MNPKQSCKILLVGDGEAGKSYYMETLLTGTNQNKKYIPTLGVEVHPLKIPTEEGNIDVVVWDIAGEEKFGGLRDGYYIGADAVIYFKKDIHTPVSKNWKIDIERMCSKIPSVTITRQISESSKYGAFWKLLKRIGEKELAE